jgi:hypothetical protein
MRHPFLASVPDIIMGLLPALVVPIAVSIHEKPGSDGEYLPGITEGYAMIAGEDLLTSENIALKVDLVSHEILREGRGEEAESVWKDETSASPITVLYTVQTT